MATFKEIRGQLIKKYTTNPAEPLEGQMWFNNTTGTLKGSIATEAWRSAAPLATGRNQMATGGTQTAAFGAGGYNSTDLNNTEEYDGSGWSAGGNLTTARRYLAGCGTLTAGLAFGGNKAPTPTPVFLSPSILVLIACHPTAVLCNPTVLSVKAS